MPQPDHRRRDPPLCGQSGQQRRRESGAVLYCNLCIPAADLRQMREQHSPGTAGRGVQPHDQRPHPPHDADAAQNAATDGTDHHSGKGLGHPALL